MAEITLFGQQYDTDALPAQIELECGCIYIKEDAKFGFAYSLKTTCTTHEYPIDIDELKNTKLEEMNTFIQGKIYATYSREKQFNILASIDGFDETEKTEMLNFINDILSKQETLKSNINSKSSIPDLDSFAIETEYNNLT